MTMPPPHRFLADPDTAIRHISESLHSALRDYTVQTALVLQDHTDNFELVMHHDLINVIDTSPNLFLRLPGWCPPIYGVDRRFMGFKVVGSHRVGFDHPELRSTWKWVI